MANEINIQLDPFLETGLTLIAKIFNKTGAQQGSNISLSETSTGFYTGNFDLGSLADGDYVVKFQTSTEFYGSGELKVKDGIEAEASSGLDAAGIRSAIGLASANLDTQLSAIDDYLDTEVAAIKSKTDNLPVNPAQAGEYTSAIAAIPTTKTGYSLTEDYDAAKNAASQTSLNNTLSEITSDLTVINDGIKKSSLLIPHTDNL